MTVTQETDGTCHVYEHDLLAAVEEGEDVPMTKTATFWPEDRVVTQQGEFGPEMAMRDLAQIRAMIFATTMEQLVNTGKVDLG